MRRIFSAGRRFSNRSGLTLLEVTMSTLIVGLILVAALNTIGGSMAASLANK